MPIITTNGVSRRFRSPKKGEGFRGAINLILKPEYQSHEALKGVSFAIEEGSFNGLIGANGAGKTTLLKILSGLIAPTAGEARVLGYDPFRRALDFRRKIALVMGQKAQLWWDLPALDAFDLLQAIYEIPEDVYRKRLGGLAELLAVQKHLQTQIRRLSLGERMKMELIGALIHWPKVVFLDEPTIGLDVLAAANLRDFLREFNRREHATIILTSHNMDDIERLCSRVLILRTGELIYDGRPEGLTKKGECRLRVRLMQKPTLEELAAVAAVPVAAIHMPGGNGFAAGVEAAGAAGGPHAHGPGEDEEAGNGHGAEPDSIAFTIKYEEIVGVLQRLMSKFSIVSMGIEEQSLESVIQRLYLSEQSS